MRDITVAIIAASYHGNKGAAAMLQSSIQQLHQRYGAALRVKLMSTYPQGDKKLLPHNFIRVVSCTPEQLVFLAFPLAILYWLFRWFAPLRKLIAKNKIIQAYTQTDLVIDEAGISFVDSRGFVMNLYAFITNAVPMLLGVPVVKYSQAMGTFNGRFNRLLAKIILPKVRLICARGQITKDNLAGIGITQNVVLCADGAFSMADDPAITAEVDALCGSDPFFGPNVIGLSLSSVVEGKCEDTGIDYRATMVEFVNALTARGFPVLLIANAARLGSNKRRNNDLVVCDAVYNAVKDPSLVRWYHEEMPPEKIRELIARCRLLVAARFHAMIGALEKGVPTLLVGWSHKYKEVLDMFGLGNCAVDYSGLSADMLLQRFDEMLADEDNIRQSIAAHLPDVITSSRQNIAEVSQIIDRDILPGKPDIPEAEYLAARLTEAEEAAEDGEDAPEPPSLKRRAANFLGRILMVAAFAYIIYTIVHYEIDFSVLLAPSVLIGLIALLPVHACNNIFASVLYSRLLNVMAAKVVNHLTVVRIYCRTFVYRYVPGNIMHYIARNQIAIEEDVSHSEVALTTVMEALFMMIAGFIITAVCVFNDLITYVSQMHINWTIVVLIAVALVVVAAVAILLRRKIAKFVRKYLLIMKRLSFKTCALYILSVGGRLLINASIYLCILLLLGQPITLQVLPRIIGLFVMSWLIGFIVPGAPAGLGVREAVMLMFMGDVLSQNVLVSSAVIYRLFCIVGDVCALLLSRGYLKIRARSLNRR